MYTLLSPIGSLADPPPQFYAGLWFIPVTTPLRGALGVIGIADIYYDRSVIWSLFLQNLKIWTGGDAQPFD
jgi:hypothetical protein